MAHGNACQTDALVAIGYDLAGAYNSRDAGSVARTFECPLNITYQEGSLTTIVQANTVVVNHHRTQTVSCTLENVDFDGGVLFSNTVISAVGDPHSTPQRLFYTIPAGTLAPGVWRVHCFVPPPDNGVQSFVTGSMLMTSE